jgi:hypothetical protein
VEKPPFTPQARAAPDATESGGLSRGRKKGDPRNTGRQASRSREAQIAAEGALFVEKSRGERRQKKEGKQKESNKKRKGKRKKQGGKGRGNEERRKSLSPADLRRRGANWDVHLASSSSLGSRKCLL